jgi:hypothetical protein
VTAKDQGGSLLLEQSLRRGDCEPGLTGNDTRMTHSQTDTTNGITGAVAHPAAAATQLTSEVKRGRSWRTPFLALGGTALIVAACVVVVLAVAFAAYSFAK